MLNNGLRVQMWHKSDDDLLFADRLRHRYLLFMWHVFREAFVSEINKQEHDLQFGLATALRVAIPPDNERAPSNR